MPTYPLPSDKDLGVELREIDRRLSELEGARAGTYGIFGAAADVNTDAAIELTPFVSTDLGVTVEVNVTDRGRLLIMYGASVVLNDVGGNASAFMGPQLDGVALLPGEGAEFNFVGLDPGDLGVQVGSPGAAALIATDVAAGAHTVTLKAIQITGDNGFVSDPWAVCIPV